MDKRDPDFGKTGRVLEVLDPWLVRTWAELCGWGSRQGCWERRPDQEGLASRSCESGARPDHTLMGALGGFTGSQSDSLPGRPLPRWQCKGRSGIFCPDSAEGAEWRGCGAINHINR